jgi:phosphatidylinositol alpha-mannosyltransferase
MYVAPNTGGESFGIVLLEAMACHTPVVASDLPAFVRVLDYGKSGLIFENESATELAQSLRTLLLDPSLGFDFANAGFERVQEFDWSRVATQILDVYATVIAGSGPVQEDLRGQIVGRLAPDTQ